MLKMRSSAILIAVLAAAACNDSTSPSSSTSLNGTWDWTGYYVTTASSSTCRDTGSFVFNQSDTTFIGTSEHIDACTAPSGADHVFDSIRAGLIRGTAVTFSIYTSSGGGFLCSDTAVLSTASSPVLSGIASCGSATLTWTAAKAQPVTSVAISPDTARTVVGGTWIFDAVLHTATGARVFGRTVTWAVDHPEIAKLDTFPLAALLTATGPGTATVTATVNEKSANGALVVATLVGLSGTSAGDARTCALDPTGAPSCWGAGFGGGTYSNVPAPVGTVLKFTAVSVGGEFACGLTSGGDAYCWGANESGQLGNNTTTASATPVIVRSVAGASYTGLAAGYRYACGWTSAGVAYCWGDNSNGQLGLGTTTNATEPRAVTGGVSFASVSARQHHTCGVATNGTLFCWGDNSVGQLGDNTTTQHTVPTRVSGTLSYTAVSVGVFGTCALATGGAPYCWGSPVGGFAVNGTEQHVPTALGGGKTFIAISVGDDHACAVTAQGTAWCWGANTWGQLGTGASSSSGTPVAVAGSLVFGSISAGVYTYSDEGHSSHSCGVTTGGITYCWGDNLTGQLGNGSHVQSLVPVKVAGQP